MVGVRAQLLGSYALCFVFLVALVWVGLSGVQTLQSQGRVVAEQTAPYLNHLSDAAVAAKSAANDERGFLMTGKKGYALEFDGRVPSVTAALEAASGTAQNAAQRSAVADVASGFTSWVDAVNAEFTTAATDPAKATSLALGPNRELRKRYEASFASATQLAKNALSGSITNQNAVASNARRTLLVLLFVGFVAAVGIALWISRLVTVPLAKLRTLLTAAATGDFTGRATHDSGDEFGVLGRAYNTMVDSLSGVLATISGNASDLSGAAEELQVLSAQINASAEDSSAQATLVAAAAEEVSVNVQTVAGATEEMSSSIREIAKNTNDAAGVAAHAVDAAQTASLTVATLGESSAEIGTVVKVINSIAEQTNLLALNATIEAARAGEAGKGFAVVASEVKELARETSKATEDIGQRIDAIQSDAKAAVSAITQISAIIQQINDTQATIASAVEEQTATTNEMSRNVADAATGSSEIASNITGVATSAAATTEGVTQTLVAAARLSRMSVELTALVSGFTYTSRGTDGQPASSVEATITKAIEWQQAVA